MALSEYQPELHIDGMNRLWARGREAHRTCDGIICGLIAPTSSSRRHDREPRVRISSEAEESEQVRLRISKIDSTSQAPSHHHPILYAYSLSAPIYGDVIWDLTLPEQQFPARPCTPRCTCSRSVGPHHSLLLRLTGVEACCRAPFSIH